MPEEMYECGECGKVFGSEETLQEHSRLEHGHSAVIERRNVKVPGLEGLKKTTGKHINTSFLLGLILGIALTLGGFAAYDYATPDNPRQTVPITVITCDNCSYSKFRSASDRLFKTEYTEVNYQSEKGQRLINKYNFKYVPAFIFDKQALRKAENFSKVKPVLVEFEDAYVIPDEGLEKAQMLSDGFQLGE